MSNSIFSSYRRNVKALSALMKRRRYHPMENAIWLLEFVSATSGAEHLLHSCRRMTLAQYFSADVVAFLVAMAFASVKLASMLCCRRKKREGKAKSD